MLFVNTVWTTFFMFLVYKIFEKFECHVIPIHKKIVEL